MNDLDDVEDRLGVKLVMVSHMWNRRNQSGIQPPSCWQFIGTELIVWQPFHICTSKWVCDSTSYPIRFTSPVCGYLSWILYTAIRLPWNSLASVDWYSMMIFRSHPDRRSLHIVTPYALGLIYQVGWDESADYGHAPGWVHISVQPVWSASSRGQIFAFVPETLVNLMLLIIAQVKQT